MASTLRSWLTFGLLALSPVSAEPIKAYREFAALDAWNLAGIQERDLYGGAASVCRVYTTEYMAVPTSAWGGDGGYPGGSGGPRPSATGPAGPVQTVWSTGPGQPFTLSLAGLLAGPNVQVTSFTETPPVNWLYYDPVTRSFYGTVPVDQAPGKIIIHVKAVDAITGQTYQFDIELDISGSPTVRPPATPTPSGTPSSTSSYPAASVSMGPAQTIVVGLPYSIDLSTYLKGPADIITGSSSNPDLPFLDSGFNAAGKKFAGTVPADTKAPQTVSVAFSAIRVGAGVQARDDNNGLYVVQFNLNIAGATMSTTSGSLSISSGLSTSSRTNIVIPTGANSTSPGGASVTSGASSVPTGSRNSTVTPSVPNPSSVSSVSTSPGSGVAPSSTTSCSSSGACRFTASNSPASLATFTSTSVSVLSSGPTPSQSGTISPSGSTRVSGTSSSPGASGASLSVSVPPASSSSPAAASPTSPQSSGAVSIPPISFPSPIVQAKVLPLVCQGLSYESKGTNLYTLNLTTGISVGLNSTNPSTGNDNINALAYHPSENFLYAVAQNYHYNGYVLRIGAGGAVENTTWTIPQTNANGTYATTMNVGDIDADQQYWLGYNSGDNWVQVDVNSAHTTYGQVINNGSTSNRGGATVSDWAYLPSHPNRLYTLGQVGSTGARSTQLMYLDLQTKAWVNVFLFTGVSGGTSGQAQWGAIYTALDGYIYGLENNSGQIWKFKVDGVSSVGDATQVATGPTGSPNDGARCMLNIL